MSQVLLPLYLRLNISICESTPSVLFFDLLKASIVQIYCGCYNFIAASATSFNTLIYNRSFTRVGLRQLRGTSVNSRSKSRMISFPTL